MLGSMKSAGRSGAASKARLAASNIQGFPLQTSRPNQTAAPSFEFQKWPDRLARMSAVTGFMKSPISPAGESMPKAGSPEDQAAVIRIHETTLKLEKLLADRMASKDSVPVRRKPKHRPGLVTYQA